MKDTPMMKQYKSFKRNYPDKIVLFRMGDFYETFGDDAVIASKVLNITLTSRDKATDPTPLAGFPHHALDQYLPKIIESGNCAVIVEQLEDPKLAKGVVKRGVTRIVTPGTLDGEMADSKKSPFLLCTYTNKNIIGIAYCDISTGELKVAQIENSPDELSKVISSIDPSEVLISEKDRLTVPFSGSIQIGKNPPAFKLAAGDIATFFKLQNVESLGLHEMESALLALWILLEYIKETQQMVPEHIGTPEIANFSKSMILDNSTIRNLDLVVNSYTGRSNDTLLEILDHTGTTMGKRRLYSWILNPLIGKKMIDHRLNIVELFFNDLEKLNSAREILKGVNDIERIVGKIGLNRANGRDLKSLQYSTQKGLELLELLQEDEHFTQFVKGLRGAEAFGSIQLKLNETVELIDRNIADEPPLTITDGGVIKKGVDEQIDQLKELSGNSKEWIEKLEKEEREKYGIPSLKIRYNKVHGYYIEVTKTHQEKVPDHYIRKQTLVNSERYITEELKEREEQILTAHDKLSKLEYEKFMEVREKLLEYLESLKYLGFLISVVDVLQSFANVSRLNSYVRPTINGFDDDGELSIVEGRHPVIEQISSEPFISNDTKIGSDEGKMIIITGPNMSGKSTYIRQVAIICLMAQIGCFVPATEASISLVDRIFSRVGAGDNLAQGRSTFMVEMEEAANIVNNATQHSLIILDEVGRGTSTYDGVSIAWALVEYLTSQIKARTLFATHYHELTSLSDEHPGLIRNYNVEVKENAEDDEVVFMRRIVEGSTDKSYGIYVAKLAGLPTPVIDRANQIMSTLDLSVEKNGKGSKVGALPEEKKKRTVPKPEVQFQLFDDRNSEVINLLHDIDPDNLTPLDALQLIAKLKEALKNDKD